MDDRFERDADLQSAMVDFRALLSPVAGGLVRATLFGSTLKDGRARFNDVDLLVGIYGMTFGEFVARLGPISSGRRAIVESADDGYSNHPRWPDSELPPLHVVVYAAASALTPKLRLGVETGVDVTARVR